MRSPRSRLDKRAGRLGRISLGVVLGWVGGMLAVAVILSSVRASDEAHARAVCAAHHQIFIGTSAPRRFIRPTTVRCFTFTRGSANDPISTYSLHHGGLTDALDVLLFLLLFGVCVVAGYLADRGIRGLLRAAQP